MNKLSVIIEGINQKTEKKRIKSTKFRMLECSIINCMEICLTRECSYALMHGTLNGKQCRLSVSRMRSTSSEGFKIYNWFQPVCHMHFSFKMQLKIRCLHRRRALDVMAQSMHIWLFWAAKISPVKNIGNRSLGTTINSVMCIERVQCTVTSIDEIIWFSV